MNCKVTVVIEADEDGFYAYAPELEGCQSEGDSLDAILTNIKEAIELYLETLSYDEIKQRLSKTVLTTSLEVAIASPYSSRSRKPSRSLGLSTHTDEGKSPHLYQSRG
jgi:predicted RNase H-like HicB family nuclease